MARVGGAPTWYQVMVGSGCPVTAHSSVMGIDSNTSLCSSCDTNVGAAGTVAFGIGTKITQYR